MVDAKWGHAGFGTVDEVLGAECLSLGAWDLHIFRVFNRYVWL